MKNSNILDLTHLSWTLSRKSSGTAGSFLKAYEQLPEEKYYYKMSNFDTVRGIYGHECLNEIVSGNIADVLNIPHLKYDLLHAKVKIGENLKKVPKGMIEKVQKTIFDEKILFKNLEHLKEAMYGPVVPQYWDCIKKMVNERVKNIEKILN